MPGLIWCFGISKGIDNLAYYGKIIVSPFTMGSGDFLAVFSEFMA
jgi:hypothetical protein